MKRTNANSTKRKPYESKLRAVAIPPQDEVYRGVQILWDGYVYWIIKPSGKIEASTNIEMIRAAIDLIHYVEIAQPTPQIDMAAVARMTEDTP